MAAMCSLKDWAELAVVQRGCKIRSDSRDAQNGGHTVNNGQERSITGSVSKEFLQLQSHPNGLRSINISSPHSTARQRFSSCPIIIVGLPTIDAVADACWSHRAPSICHMLSNRWPSPAQLYV